MTGQQPLLKVAPVLRPRQQAAYDYLAEHGRASAAAVGANWYRLTGRGHVDSAWHEGEGLSVLRSRALRGLVVRRRATGLWELRERKPDRGAQLDGLPEWLQDCETVPAPACWGAGGGD